MPTVRPASRVPLLRVRVRAGGNEADAPSIEPANIRGCDGLDGYPLLAAVAVCGQGTALSAGKVLYARALTGHPLLRAAAIQGACKTEFKEYSYHKHQGIMEFTVDNYDYLTVPFLANVVWE